MTTNPVQTGLQLRSLVKASGELEISLISVETPSPSSDEVVVRIEATPVNPSDIGLLLAAAEISTAVFSGTGTRPVVTARIPPQSMQGMAGRLGQSMSVGNEGAGVVIATGDSEAARAMMGKTVAVMGGAMYSQYRCLKVGQCMVLPEGTSPADGASSFINPLTALGMVTTMLSEGHKALVHTAAASSLGQMLNRVCIKDRIDLVNIVRKPEQVEILRRIGAKYVCDSSSPKFLEELTQALAETGATIAFDATGGGKLAGEILTCMEAALNRTATTYSRYGTAVHKQVYIYGGLDTNPTQFTRGFGMAWGIGGWLLFSFLERIGLEAAQKLRQRVTAELKTVFASSYSKQISLAEALQPEAMGIYAQRATGTKYLINPNK